MFKVSRRPLQHLKDFAVVVTTVIMCLTSNDYTAVYGNQTLVSALYTATIIVVANRCRITTKSNI